MIEAGLKGGKISMIGYPDPDKGERRGGKGADSPEIWIGHLAAIHVIDGHPFLIDLSIDQGNKTTGMALAPFVQQVGQDFISGKHGTIIEMNDCLLAYESFPGETSCTAGADIASKPLSRKRSSPKPA